MSLKDALLRLVGRHYFERPARKRSLPEHAEALRRSGDALRQRLSELRPDARAHERLRHVIGIERWGQRRLAVLRGEPLVMDGHRAYQPAADASWEELLEAFADTRADTVRLADQLAAAEPAGLVPHNQFGDLSARGWLRYLDGHARVEARRLK